MKKIFTMLTIPLLSLNGGFRVHPVILPSLIPQTVAEPLKPNELASTHVR
jgi:hypothetical protein